MRLSLAAMLAICLLAPDLHAAQRGSRRPTAQKTQRPSKRSVTRPAAPSLVTRRKGKQGKLQLAPSDTSTPAPADKTPAPAGNVTLADAASSSPTAEQRGQIAVEAVERSLAPWVGKGTQVDIRPAIVPFNGDPRNPITGAGPVEVFVEQNDSRPKGFLGRLFARFNPFAKQKYLVNVCKNGNACVLERISLAPQRRFTRFIANHLPIGTLAVDFLKSDKAAEGLWTMLGAGGAAAVSPLISGALIMRAFQVVRDGIKSQDDVRRRALDETVKWAHDTFENEKRWPTLMEAYRDYKGAVEEEHSGARPLELGAFAEALSIRNL
jgi:hypothetical protein